MESKETKKIKSSEKLKDPQEIEDSQETKESQEKVCKGIKNEKDQKICELTETLQRLQAEFENFRKRTEREKEEFRQYAKADSITRFLPVIDNLKLALKHTEKSDDFSEGIKLIYSQMISELENMGVKRIEAMGEIFNPRLHEALMADYSDKPKDIIIEEFQTGYTLGEKILRNSKVKISKGPEEEQEDAPEKDITE